MRLRFVFQHPQLAKSLGKNSVMRKPKFEVELKERKSDRSGGFQGESRLWFTRPLSNVSRDCNFIEKEFENEDGVKTRLVERTCSELYWWLSQITKVSLWSLSVSLPLSNLNSSSLFRDFCLREWHRTRSFRKSDRCRDLSDKSIWWRESLRTP